MKILAFDVGSRWNGWAVVETGPSIRRIASGQERSDSLPESFSVVRAVLADWPDVGLVAVEKSFPPKASTKNWEETAQVRGAIKSGVPAGVEVVELTAQQVRARLGITPLTGRKKSLSFLRGMTADARVKAAVEKIFNCKTAGSHESDALALAWVVAVENGDKRPPSKRFETPGRPAKAYQHLRRGANDGQPLASHASPAKHRPTERDSPAARRILT